MNAEKPSKLSPWDPYRLFSLFIFITWFGAGILLGLNWKRLGKPDWVLKTVLLSIFIPAGMIVLIFAWVLLFLDVDLPQPLLMSIPMLGITANFGYLWALARLQNGAYKKFKEQGTAALQDYPYDVDSAMTFGVVVSVAFGVGLTLILSVLG